ncbi:hypothetical protein F53441_6004 [Fusarium austroafricanum]|uniref:Uncharacterized protein n=1 Tax=Fusarium austroafricanum TaxID=2364996 RepID=A0A8H4KKN0_9HYPO|nr:hypothetical protein F53441_6004 [Fusarium austroafricanum]
MAAAPSPRPGAMPSDLAFPQDTHPRLSVATPTRLLLGTLSSTLVGFSLGATQGGQMAQLRFRAEHAHKMPDTTTGWYFYHKSKNYHAMQGGIREGFRMGLKTGFWSMLALSLESTVDRYRGASDMFSTTIATLTVAGAFSLWPRWNTKVWAKSKVRYGSRAPFVMSAYVITSITHLIYRLQRQTISSPCTSLTNNGRVAWESKVNAVGPWTGISSSEEVTRPVSVSAQAIS